LAKTERWGKPAAWLAAIFLIATFVLGGGARSDILSLVILRPFAVVVLGIGLLTLTRAEIERHRLLFGSLGAIAVLAIVQLIPLPPGIWHQLPGHGVVKEIDATVGLDGLWRPISLAPNGTLNALMALVVPLAFLVHVAKLDTAGMRRLLIIAIALGLLSALIGVAQAVGTRGNGLYFYRITNDGFAVGLFSNRNHQAVFLASLFPMLAAYASFPVKAAANARIRLILVLLAGAALIPLLLITGSRLGAALGILGILSTRWVYHAPEVVAVRRRESKRKNYAPLIIGIVGIGLVAITAFLAQVSIFERFAGSSDAMTDIRFRVWQPILKMSWDFFPFGSGLGSFAEVYRVYEPNELLGTRYLNHAHNDFLEVFLTAGLAGLAIMGVAGVSLAHAAFRASRLKNRDRDVSLYRMGAVVVTMLAVASLVDYPLRTPSIACVFILAAVCLRRVRTSEP
jgi:O-antigen ligase